MAPKERTARIPGLNIQYPWSRLILNKKKVVETRHYPLPEKHLDKEIALIETPGKEGRKVGVETKIIGVIKVKECFQYSSKSLWEKDKKRHLVEKDDPIYKYHEDKPKWGWLIEVVTTVPPQDPPETRGIKYAKECLVVY